MPPGRNRGDPRFSNPLVEELRREVRRVKAERGMSWPRAAADMGVPRGTLEGWVFGRAGLRLEWAVRLAVWCGLELALAPSSQLPTGMDEFGDPDGDEGGEA